MNLLSDGPDNMVQDVILLVVQQIYSVFMVGNVIALILVCSSQFSNVWVSISVTLRVLPLLHTSGQGFVSLLCDSSLLVVTVML